MSVVISPRRALAMADHVAALAAVVLLLPLVRCSSTICAANGESECAGQPLNPNTACIGRKISGSQEATNRTVPVAHRCRLQNGLRIVTCEELLGALHGVATVLSSALALCCRVLVCLPLLWTRHCAFKPSRLSEVRASRCPAGRLAPRGRTGGVRRASLLLLAPWLAVCTAAGTICSRVPTVCDGTYSGTSLCALPPLPPPPPEL